MFCFTQNEYIKDGKKAMRDHHLPVDAHQFAKAKEVAKNLSDVSDKDSKKKNNLFKQKTVCFYFVMMIIFSNCSLFK